MYSSLPPTTPGTSHNRLAPSRGRGPPARSAGSSTAPRGRGRRAARRCGSTGTRRPGPATPGPAARPGRGRRAPRPAPRPAPRASRGSTSTAASPATSPAAVSCEVTTATPWAMASSTGSPKPSCRLGRQNTAGPGQQGPLVGLGDEAELADPAVGRPDVALQVLVPAPGPDQHQVQSVAIEPSEGLEQDGQVLARLDGAGPHHVGLVEVVGGPHPLDLGRGGPGLRPPPTAPAPGGPGRSRSGRTRPSWPGTGTPPGGRPGGPARRPRWKNRSPRRVEWAGSSQEAEVVHGDHQGHGGWRHGHARDVDDVDRARWRAPPPGGAAGATTRRGPGGSGAAGARRWWAPTARAADGGDGRSPPSAPGRRGPAGPARRPAPRRRCLRARGASTVRGSPRPGPEP